MKSNAVKILDKFRLENIPIEIININAMGKQWTFSSGGSRLKWREAHFLY